MSIHRPVVLFGFLVLIILCSCTNPAQESQGANPSPASPASPVNLRYSGLTDTRVTIAWSSAMPDSSGNWYLVYRDGDLLALVQDREFNDTLLTPQTSYSYTIRTRNRAGVLSAPSTSLNVRTTAPLAGPARTFFIDPVNGNDDSHDGLSASTAWRSFVNVSSYFTTVGAPGRRIILQPGDTVYVLNGTISQICRPGDDNGPANVSGRPAVLYLRFVHGTSDKPIRFLAYPGHEPLIDAAYQGEGICIEQSSGLEISGIDITRGLSGGEGGNIRLQDSSRIILSDCTVSMAGGRDNDNISGLNCTRTSDVVVKNCVFHDNYDRTAADTGGIGTPNSTNMVFFGGEDITVRDCLIYQTPAANASTNSGGGIKYKHSTGNPDGFFRVYNNVFRNCKFFSVETGSANSHVHHNIVIGGNIPFHSQDCGGPTHQVNQIFEYNTVYLPLYESDAGVAESAFYYRPTNHWRNAQFPNDPKNIVFRRNIVFQSGRYTLEHGTLTMDCYISDAMYRLAMTELFVDHNVYYNSNGHSLRFSMAAASGGAYGPLGGDFLWPQWQSLGQDQHSMNQDPQFQAIDLSLTRYDPASTAFLPVAGSPAASMGAYAGLDD